MKKILLFAALLVSAMSWAEVQITITPNVIDFGTIELNDQGEAEVDSVAKLTWSGIAAYGSVYVDTLGVYATDDYEFWAVKSDGDDFWYCGDMYNPADDPTVYVGIYAIAPGEYSIKYSFYSFIDDDWTVKSQGAELTLKAKVVKKSATGLDGVASKIERRKIMRDGQMLIIRNGETYSATGAVVK